MPLVICWTGCSRNVPEQIKFCSSRQYRRLGGELLLYLAESIRLNGQGHYQLPPQQSLFCPLIVQPSSRHFTSVEQCTDTDHLSSVEAEYILVQTKLHQTLSRLGCLS